MRVSPPSSPLFFYSYSLLLSHSRCFLSLFFVWNLVPSCYFSYFAPFAPNHCHCVKREKEKRAAAAVYAPSLQVSDIALFGYLRRGAPSTYIELIKSLLTWLRKSFFSLYVLERKSTRVCMLLWGRGRRGKEDS